MEYIETLKNEKGNGIMKKEKHAGRLLIKWRRDRNWNESTLARYLNISLADLIKIESTGLCPPNVSPSKILAYTGIRVPLDTDAVLGEGSTTENTPGQRLREWRLNNGVSGRDLAKKIGTTAATISHLEIGKQKTLRRKIAKKLFDITGIEFLICYDVDPVIPQKKSSVADQFRAKKARVEELRRQVEEAEKIKDELEALQKEEAALLARLAEMGVE